MSIGTVVPSAGRNHNPLAMKNTNNERTVCGAGKCATHVNSTGKKAIPVAALVLLLLRDPVQLGLHRPDWRVQDCVRASKARPVAAAISVAPASIKFRLRARWAARLLSRSPYRITGGSNLTITQGEHHGSWRDGHGYFASAHDRGGETSPHLMSFFRPKRREPCRAMFPS